MKTMPKSNLQKAMVFLLLSFITLNGYGQQLMNSFPVELRTNRDVFHVNDSKSNESIFFLSDRIKVRGYFLDHSLKFKDTLSCERPNKQFKDILGYSGNIENTSIYWSTPSEEKYAVQTFNFKDRKTNTKILDLKETQKNEKLIDYFSENEKFYILNINTDENTLLLYEFQNDSFQKTTIDIKKYEFYGSEKYTNIFGEEKERIFSGSLDHKIKKIKSDSPVSLDDCTHKRKVYSNKDEIVFTFDLSNDFTQLFIIDLKTKTERLLNIQKPKLDNPEKQELNSNSFYIDDKLIQISTLKDRLSLSLNDNKGNLIKQYIINNTDEFKIKNSNFVRESQMGTKRKLETTEQFLRKIARHDIAVSCYKIDGNYFVKIGAVDEVNHNAGGVGSPLGASIGSAGNIIAHPINTTNYNYYTFTINRYISTTSLFNENFDHIPTVLKPLAFEKIEKFKIKAEQITTKLVFKIGETYYLGHYTFDKKYNFRKFTDN
jgi:hypothetical protein